MNSQRILAFFALLTLAACGSDNSNGGNSTPPLTGALALINGISDSGGLKADVSNVPTIGPIDFGGASGINIIPAGSYKVQLTPGAAGSSAFTVDNVSIDGNGGAVASGQLTLHGITRPVTLQVVRLDCSGESTVPDHPCGFAARANIKRSDFGLPHGFWLAGDQVEISVNGAALRSERRLASAGASMPQGN